MEGHNGESELVAAICHFFPKQPLATFKGNICFHYVWKLSFSFCLIIVSAHSSGVSDEEDQKPVRLPLKVAVELQPRSNYSWARVQSLAHNPRLRSDLHDYNKLFAILHKYQFQVHKCCSPNIYSA